MAKIIAWLILIFVVLFALRMINLRNARKQARASARQNAKLAEPMVRCVHCGVFLPRSEARAINDDYACASGNCAAKV